jgi:SAM-dependent methyltransferase
MTLNRDFTKIFNWIFDNLIPPFLRDSKIFMKIVFYPLFGDKTKYFMNFKEEAPFLSEKDYSNYYKILAEKHIKRETDLNKKSIQYITDNIVGDNILDIASGRGFLVNYLAEKYPNKFFTGIDIFIPENSKNLINTKFQTGNIENINYPDKHFDTVICAHTLEHVQNINKAISELKRITKQKLIIIVPRQREYKFTFDLHLHFFPYLFSFQKLMNNTNAIYKIIDNDIVYNENIK